jgi:hypothetical protein
MNIFYLNNAPKICAQMHVDKHCVKMILESAQLLSTAHRVLDGVETIAVINNRKVRKWELPDDRQSILYSATHINHPSAVWVRQSAANYTWLYNLFVELCNEYTYRYGKVHKCQREIIFLQLARIPQNIPDKPFTEPTPAMPEQYRVAGDAIQSYHNYYNGEKTRMFAWKNRNVPEFINKNIL